MNYCYRDDRDDREDIEDREEECEYDIDSSWIDTLTQEIQNEAEKRERDEQENERELYKIFYRTPNTFIHFNIIYLNRAREVVSTIRFKHNLSVVNIIPQSELMEVIQKYNRRDDRRDGRREGRSTKHILYSIDSIMIYVVDVDHDPREIAKLGGDGSGYGNGDDNSCRSFRNIIKYDILSNDYIFIKPTITFFQDLNSIIIVFAE
jgi:hypothetical protein